MADTEQGIVVTIPKDRLGEVEAEEREVRGILRRGESVLYYWTLPSIPARHAEIRRVYFCWQGAIRAWHQVRGWLLDDERVQWVNLLRYDTRSEWTLLDPSARDAVGILDGMPAPAVLLDPVIHELDDPVEQRGFQGFRYWSEDDA